MGFTGAEFTGSAGVFGMTNECRGEFGNGARMCSSVEAMETIAPPEGLLGTAWVRPVFVPAGANVGDATGTTSSPGHMDCGGWSLASDSSEGLTVSATGQFRQLVCAAARPVACCAPTKLPKAKKSRR